MPEWPSGFPYFLQFEPEFCNKELMIWVTGSSTSWFWWLYEVSPSLAAMNIINLILIFTIWWCLCVESSLGLFKFLYICYVLSFQFSNSVVSNTLWPHGLQHARPPCPSSTPRVYPNSCPLSQWCHPIISSSVVPFSSCPQSFPASGSFQMSQLFASGGQSIGVSASTSVLPVNTQD